MPRSLKYWTLSTVLGGQPELQEVEVKAWPRDLLANKNAELHYFVTISTLIILQGSVHTCVR